MKFVQLGKSLKEKVESVYLIEGDDAYFRDCAVSAVRAACNITQPLLNDVRYEGEALKGEKLSAFLNELYTLPFFDEKRLVRVYGFYPAERDWEGLQSYCNAPCASTVLVIVNEGKKANGADLKKKKGVTAVDCNKENEEMLSRWLFNLMLKASLQPDADACMQMVRYTARDAARMKKETEKLVALLGKGGKVTRAVVEEHVAKDAEYKIYELTQAASRGNAAKFEEVLSDLLRKGFDEIAALSALASHYKTLAEISAMKGSDEEIGKALSQNAYAVKKNRECVRALGAERCKELYEALYALSSGAKSGKYSKTGALSEARAKIFFG